MRRPFLSAVAGLVAAGLLPAQVSRVVLPSGPTNMWADWAQVATVPDPALPDTFVAVMPLSSVSSWAFWEPDTSMDLTFGAGNWKQLTLSTGGWAYLSSSPCAHQPAPGNAAPLSLLTTDFDYGGYTGAPGAPLFPSLSAFQPAAQPGVGGLSNTFTLERWQLRTRGFFPAEAWNACAPNGGVTPNFAGVLAARFTYSVQ